MGLSNLSLIFTPIFFSSLNNVDKKASDLLDVV
jgi:hypothetical protein